MPLGRRGPEESRPPGGYYTTTIVTLGQSYDGAGGSTKRVETKVQSTPWYQDVTTARVDYYVRSSVLGGRVITELNSVGQKTKTKVYAGGEVIAEQDEYAGGWQGLTWQRHNPVTGTEVAENTTNGGTYRKEYDPFGLELGESDPYLASAEPDYASLSGGSFYREGGNPFDGGGGCMVDGLPRSCGETMFLLGRGLAAQCPDNDCGPRVQTVIARDGDGREIGSSSRIILPGQPGWDGSFDGTYRRGEVPRGDMSIQWAGRIFNRVSGGSGGIDPFGFASFFAPQDSSIWSNDWQKLRYKGVPLSPCAKKILGDLFNGSALNVNDLRVRIGIPETIKAFATISPGAVTIGNTIYMDAGSISQFDASTVRGLAGLAHEGWHALQAKLAGSVTMYANSYLTIAAKLGAMGKDPYNDHPYENEAEEVEITMRKYIQDTYGDRPCETLGLSPKAK